MGAIAVSLYGKVRRFPNVQDKLATLSSQSAIADTLILVEVRL